jgi:hypothetical protein
MKLGFCSNVDSLFEKISSHTQVLVQSILQIVVQFPADIGRLEKYVLSIRARDQGAFDLLVKSISMGFSEVDPTVPKRYILTATIVCAPAE